MGDLLSKLLLAVLLAGVGFYYFMVYPKALVRERLAELEGPAQETAGSADAPLRHLPPEQRSPEEGLEVNAPSEEPQRKTSGWTDQELGLDFEQPWRDIPYLAWLRSEGLAPEVGQTLQDPAAQKERQARLHAAFQQDPEYWEARLAADLLERSVAALQNAAIPRDDLVRIVGEANLYADYWLHHQAGYLSEQPFEGPRPEGYNDSERWLMAQRYYVRAPRDAFPELLSFSKFALGNLAAEDPAQYGGLPTTLRHALLHDHRTAWQLQQAAIPPHPRH